MADTKISDFAAQTTMLAADLMVTAQEDASNKKITWENLRLASNVFPATAVPSGDANTLDDYEEGTWTPAVLFGGAAVGVAYNAGNTTGIYTKIGEMVFIAGIMHLTDKGESTGTVVLPGLPFENRDTVQGDACPLAILSSNMTFVNVPAAIVEKGTSTIGIWEMIDGGGAATQITNAEFANTTFIRFSGSYRIA